MAEPFQTEGKSFEELEQFAIDRAHELFLANKGTSIQEYMFFKTLGIADEAVGRQLYRRLDSIGAIDQTEDPMAGMLHRRAGQRGPFYRYSISPRIVDIAAERKAEADKRGQPPDRVSEAERWARTHPFWSKLFIALVVLTFLAALTNQVWELVEKFSDLQK